MTVDDVAVVVVERVVVRVVDDTDVVTDVTVLVTDVCVVQVVVVVGMDNH